MATIAPPNLLRLADDWEDAIATAIFAGIVADDLHVAPTKHKSFNDNPAGSWPRQHSKDKQGPRTRACALDMRMALADMKLVHNRFKAVFFNRATDSRAKYIAAFNGWDGTGSPGRYNMVTGEITITDASHEWHEHVELFYLYCGDDAESQRAARAVASVVRGLSDAQWQALEFGGENLVTTQAEFNKFMDEWVISRTDAGATAAPIPNVRSRLRTIVWQYDGGGIPDDMSTLNVVNETLLKVREIKTDLGMSPAGAAAMIEAITNGVVLKLEEIGLGTLSKSDVEDAVRSVLKNGVDAPSAPTG